MELKGILVFLFLVIHFIALADGFRSSYPKSARIVGIKTSASKIDITGKHLEVTEPLRAKIQEKIGGVLEKLGKDVIRTHVTLHCERHDGDQAQIVEVTMNM